MRIEPIHGPCGRHSTDEEPCPWCALQAPYRAALEALQRDLRRRGRFVTDPIDRGIMVRDYHAAAAPLIRAMSEIEARVPSFRFYLVP